MDKGLRNRGTAQGCCSCKAQTLKHRLQHSHQLKNPSSSSRMRTNAFSTPKYPLIRVRTNTLMKYANYIHLSYFIFIIQ